MSANSFGRILRLTTFGESHGAAVGGVLDNPPANFSLNLLAVQAELDRRRPGTSAVTTARQEADTLEILSGLMDGVTTGTPIAFLIRNRDARSSDYSKIKDIYRPGHGDFGWWQKHGIYDYRGGGRGSGRETAARVAAGAMARQFLAARGVQILGHVVSVGSITATSFDQSVIETNPVRCADPLAAVTMESLIVDLKNAGDSVGGIVELRATGIPPGWGDPVFDKLDALIGGAMFSIGAVKGVEFGDGFGLATMRGSEANDPMTTVGFVSNHAGGILGGFSTGQEIRVRLAVKPASSISMSQDTIDRDGNACKIQVEGRHDPCICPRLVVVAEAMLALVLCDAMMYNHAVGWGSGAQPHAPTGV